MRRQADRRKCRARVVHDRGFHGRPADIESDELQAIGHDGFPGKMSGNCIGRARAGSYSLRSPASGILPASTDREVGMRAVFTGRVGHYSLLVAVVLALT